MSGREREATEVSGFGGGGAGTIEVTSSSFSDFSTSFSLKEVSGRIGSGGGMGWEGGGEGAGGEDGIVIWAVQPNRKMDKAKKSIAPFNMNEISTSLRFKITQQTAKFKRFFESVRFYPIRNNSLLLYSGV